ncbi:hypothetical protein [Peribacillus sp. ACCC06369]|uniref:hypothetical protein n=1 Tax=Peribacillus sp. ACCC06369 TaxID=3055860 RepID=UPI0025A2E14D|nr:hypothetical protein [Peribacillus sp. ACCC06369]
MEILEKDIDIILAGLVEIRSCHLLAFLLNELNGQVNGVTKQDIGKIMEVLIYEKGGSIWYTQKQQSKLI